MDNKGKMCDIRLITVNFPYDHVFSGNEGNKIIEKLSQTSESLYENSVPLGPHGIHEIEQNAVQKFAIGPRYIAFLTQNGYIGRINFCVNYTTRKKPVASDDKDNTSDKGSHSNQGRQRPQPSRSKSNVGASTGFPSGGIRLIRTTTSSSGVRSRNLPILTSSSPRMMVSQSQVPEDLITQVQNILQGKSRNVIIKELQRSNLDVNTAVNNLLSRDDEEADEVDEGEYIQCEDLMTWLDNGFGNCDNARVVLDPEAAMPEHVIYSGLINSERDRNRIMEQIRNKRRVASRTSSSNRSTTSTQEALNRSGELESVLVDVPSASWPVEDKKPTSKNNKEKTDSGFSADFNFGENVDWWLDGSGNRVLFKNIASMHSELMAVDDEGRLRQWKWDSKDPYEEDGCIFHPRTLSLGLKDHKITHLNGSEIRASVVTNDNSICSWADEIVAQHSNALEIQCSLFEQLKNEKVKSLVVSSLYSAVLCESNRVFWWGVYPFNQRKKLIQKSQKVLFDNTDKEQEETTTEVIEGMNVCLKKFPIYRAGAVAVNLAGEVPRCGRLVDAVWDLEKKAKFVILAPNECGSGKSSKKKSKLSSRSSSFNIDALLDTNPSNQNREDETASAGIEVDEAGKQVIEEWSVSDLVFIKDIKTTPVGKVLKVDGDIIAVRFGNDAAPLLSLKNFRLVKKSDVVPMKSSTFRVLDCIQRTPKRLVLDPNLILHAIDTNDVGIIAISSDNDVTEGDMSLGVKLYNLGSGKCQTSCHLPIKPETFLPNKEDAMSDIGCQLKAMFNSTLATSSTKFPGNGKIPPNLVLDYNGMMYPIQSDENQGIRDPSWFGLPPLLAYKSGVYVDTASKQRCVLLALAFKRQRLMPDIWRRDLAAVTALLTRLEDFSIDSTDVVAMMSREKCDGYRNILHMCACVSIANSNKETRDEKNADANQIEARYKSKSSGSRSGSRENGSGSDRTSVEIMSNIRNAISNLERRIALPISRSSASPGQEPARSRYSQNDPPMNLMSLFSNQNTFDDYFGEGERWANRPQPPTNNDPADVAEALPGCARTQRLPCGRKKKEVTFNLPQDAKRGKRTNAVAILSKICTSAPFRPHLFALLCEQDANGHTPLQYAIANRAYAAARVLYDAIMSVMESCEDSNKEMMDSMMYPELSSRDDNPIHMLCSNDVCSFTWTGTLHINQDIFECRTCGLTDSLCCCTECARVCHKGHDCTLKRTSPSAYCDCWEKCSCKSLVAGDQELRMKLLQSIVKDTTYYQQANSKGENILRFLVKTVARQQREHHQHRSRSSQRISTSTVMSSRRGSHRFTTKSPPPDYLPEVPEHDLKPPKFCRLALHFLLSQPLVVASLIDHDKIKNALVMTSSSCVLPEDKAMLNQQQGISYLDSFTNTLITQCNGSEALNNLLETLVVMATTGSDVITREQGHRYCQRFIRSVIRVYIVLQAQANPEKSSSRSFAPYRESRRVKCRRVFTALISIAVKELCETAESLIAPVRMGVAQPCQDFISYHMQMSDINNSSSVAFERDPFSPSWTRPNDGDDDGNDDDDRADLDEELIMRPFQFQQEKSKNTSASTSRGNQQQPGSSGSNRGKDFDYQRLLGYTEVEVSPTYAATYNDNADYPACSQDTDTNSEGESEEGVEIEKREETKVEKQSKDREAVTKAPPHDSDPGDDDDDDDDEDDVSLHDYDSDDVEEDTGAAGGGHDNESDTEFIWDGSNLERAATRKQRVRARNVPHSLEWAMGQGEELTERLRSVRSGNGSAAGTSRSNAYISPQPLVGGAEGYKHSKLEEMMQSTNPNLPSVSITNDRLARLFGICIREVSNLLMTLNNNQYLAESPITKYLQVNKHDCIELLSYTRRLLQPTWDWLMRIVDSCEAQLRYGQALALHTTTTHPDHPNHKNESKPTKKSTDKSNKDELNNVDAMIKQNFLSYLLSLMRSHSDEHSGILPNMDVGSLRHVAYVLDAYICLLRGFTHHNPHSSRSKSEFCRTLDSIAVAASLGGSEEDEEDEFGYSPSVTIPALSDENARVSNSPVLSNDEAIEVHAQPLATFFQRSNSMSFVATNDHNSFELPVHQTLPLAAKPHLLQINSRKEELFGRPRLADDVTSTNVFPKLGLSRRYDDVTEVSMSETVSKNSEGDDVTDRKRSSEQSLESLAPCRKRPKKLTGSREGVTSQSPEKDTSSTADFIDDSAPSMDAVLSRCRLLIELFSKVFLDTVGAEPKSILYELGGFEVREAKFRKEMEQSRSSQSGDLLLKVSRDRHELIQQTFKQINLHCSRRSAYQQPLAVVRVKVTFTDEPGEGSGVARSFYTAIAEALASSEPFPNLDYLPPASSSSSDLFKNVPRSGSGGGGSDLILPFMQKVCRRVRNGSYRRLTSAQSMTSSSSAVTPTILSMAAPPFYPKSSSKRSTPHTATLQSLFDPTHVLTHAERSPQRSRDHNKEISAERLYPIVQSCASTSTNHDFVPKITGMLMALPSFELTTLVRNERMMRERVIEAIQMLVESNYMDSGEGNPPDANDRTDAAKSSEKKDEEDDEDEDTEEAMETETEVVSKSVGEGPLFFEPVKGKGFLAPAMFGDVTEARLNAYRNVGRLMGICLLQNELFPLSLCRHVLKFILGRKINWHDLAFFDLNLYESLRQTVRVYDAGESFDQTFVVDLLPEEGGGQEELVAGGNQLLVSHDNVRDYVRRYALQRMLVCCKQALEMIRSGVLDVIPRQNLEGLSPEDLRLLINGCGQVDVQTLISYTKFSDESGNSGVTAEKLTEFKRWFWWVVHHFDHHQRQELLFFWTGSPSLPASEDGFQPMPSITIRPPSEQHLPTANTCISKLYVPLYSSRQLLQQKLNLAIKTKNFGFV